MGLNLVVLPYLGEVVLVWLLAWGSGMVGLVLFNRILLLCPFLYQ